MIQENELVTLILGLGGLIFLIVARSNLKKIPSFRLLLFAYSFFLLAWIFTVSETFFLKNIQNILEHVSYMIGMGLLALWCYKFFFVKKIKK